MQNFFAKTFDELTAVEVYEILKSRAEIFIMEQNIIYLDMDDVDYKCLHCFITEDGRVTAYLRAFYNDSSKQEVQIGRVFTLRHGEGTGGKLIVESIPKIKELMGCKKIVMDAMSYATGFYEKYGFKITSEEYMKEGIPHKRMELTV